MYQQYRAQMFRSYQQARDFCTAYPQALMDAEEWIASVCQKILWEHYGEFERDYNEASYLQPFWGDYPPDDRGRQPKGDQIPWIEVGEQVVGHRLCRLLAQEGLMREAGLPSGADNRFVLQSPELKKRMQGLTDSAMVFLDIKSVGPRDDVENTVLSPYQVSGNGLWKREEENLSNAPLLARGPRAEHLFYPAVSPIYVLSDGTIAPTVHIFVKPVYRMLSLKKRGETGQPLDRIRVICVPNGLLLCVNPNYLDGHPGLLFPGKDDKQKAFLKIRCRVSFDHLRDIAPWRVADLGG